jgi:DNA-directed RNA polymerase III subunit RPC11
MKLKRKEVDDVLGGDEAWAAANKTTANCPYCDNREVRRRSYVVLEMIHAFLHRAKDQVHHISFLLPVPVGVATQAYFVQMQIRSADEPMTTFYKCTRCKNRWSGD